MLPTGTNYMTEVTGRLLNCSHNCIGATIYTYNFTIHKNNKEVKYQNLSMWQLQDINKLNTSRVPKVSCIYEKNINAQ